MYENLRFEHNGDRNILGERIVFEVNLAVLGQNVGDGFTFVGGAGHAGLRPFGAAAVLGLDNDSVRHINTLEGGANGDVTYRFLLNCSWTKMTFSVPRAIK